MATEAYPAQLLALSEEVVHKLSLLDKPIQDLLVDYRRNYRSLARLKDAVFFDRIEWTMLRDGLHGHLREIQDVAGHPDMEYREAAECFVKGVQAIDVKFKKVVDKMVELERKVFQKRKELLHGIKSL
ncbi:MAG: hypothetical protein Q9166_005903 [cf. Caloplaca sp. 2 TL-2023]